MAEAPARSFNCVYYFVGFSGELPPEAPRRRFLSARHAIRLSRWLSAATGLSRSGGNINYRAEAGLGGARRGALAAGTVLELLDGPEAADGYEWWQIGNPLEGIQGWMAQGGVISGECLRWLLPLETEADMDEAADTDAADAMMAEEPDDSAPDADDAASEDSEQNADEASE